MPERVLVSPWTRVNGLTGCLADAEQRAADAANAMPGWMRLPWNIALLVWTVHNSNPAACLLLYQIFFLLRSLWMLPALCLPACLECLHCLGLPGRRCCTTYALLDFLPMGPAWNTQILGVPLLGPGMEQTWSRLQIIYFWVAGVQFTGSAGWVSPWSGFLDQGLHI